MISHRLESPAELSQRLVLDETHVGHTRTWHRVTFTSRHRAPNVEKLPSSQNSGYDNPLHDFTDLVHQRSHPQARLNDHRTIIDDAWISRPISHTGAASSHQRHASPRRDTSCDTKCCKRVRPASTELPAVCT